MSKQGNEYNESNTENLSNRNSEVFGDTDDTISKHGSDTTDDFARDSLESRPRSSSVDSEAATNSLIDDEESAVAAPKGDNKSKLRHMIHDLQSKEPTEVHLITQEIEYLIKEEVSDQERQDLINLLQQEAQGLPIIGKILENLGFHEESHHSLEDIVTASETLTRTTHRNPYVQIATPKLDEEFKAALEANFNSDRAAVVEPILKLLAARTPQESKAAAKEVRDNAKEKVSEVYQEVFRLCVARGGSNIAHSQPEGSNLKIEIDGVSVTCQQYSNRKHRFLPDKELTKPIMIKCNKTHTILVLGPPNGQAVEVIPPVGTSLENIKAQCMFDVDHYKAVADKSQSSAVFTATAHGPYVPTTLPRSTPGGGGRGII